MNKLPISVIVPNYNSGSYLEECIKSINSGRWPAEILIIDDCSTDGSGELALALQAQYSNVRVLKREKNGGTAEARRLGISAATNDWVAIVDADDLIETDALLDAYGTAISAGADICIWELWRFDQKNSWISDANPAFLPQSGRGAALLTLGGWRIHPSGVARKILYERAYDGFNESMVNADELLVRIVFMQAGLITGSKKKYLYRVNPHSSMQSFNARRLTALRSHLWLLAFASKFPEAPIGEILRAAVWEAWFFWKNRKRFGAHQTLAELKKTVPDLFRISLAGARLWRYPRYVGALYFLCAYISVHGEALRRVHGDAQ